MFKGSRQFPPLPASHADIGRLDAERYSIWSGHCYFSERERNPFRRYWVVECTHSTRHLLPMVAELIEKSPEKLDDFFTRLREKISSQRSSRASVPQRGSTVVVLTHSLQPGGAERQWCYLAIGLKEKGFNGRFGVQENLEVEKAHYLPLLENHGIFPLELERYPLEKLISAPGDDPQSRRLLQPAAGPFDIRLLELTACLLDLRPDTVYAQLDTVNLLAGVASILADVPRCVLSFRNFNPTHFSYLRNDWYLPCYQALACSPRIVLSGNSHAANEDYARWLGVPQDHVTLVPNCIESGDFPAMSEDEKRRLRSELALQDGAPVILGVFRLSEEKDPVTFLRVCAAVARVYPQTRVLIAGVGRLQGDMEQLTRSLGLQANVTLLGRRGDVAALMSCASLLLLTSTHEGMPNVVMEAQTLGLPVVATWAGGTADLVLDGVTGYLRPISDVNGLADACLSILGHPHLRRRMGEAGRAHMTQHYSRKVMTDRYIALAAAGGRKVADEAAAPCANA
jgi:glycosyltransferase involved in cell wall biosynthesis